MNQNDIDTIIGHGSQLAPAADTGGLPRRTDTSEDEINAILKQVAGGKGSFVDGGELKRPVTQNFLALVFDMDPATVKKRLLTVKPVGFVGSGVQTRKLYDFKEACSYLVEPKIDLDAYIKSLDPAKLPNHINKMFWEAQRIRLKFMLEAGQAWRTEDVLARLGDACMLIKDRVQLWAETMREVCKLDDEQYARFVQMQNDLQNDLHALLVSAPERSTTRSIAAEYDEGGEGATS